MSTPPFHWGYIDKLDPQPVAALHLFSIPIDGPGATPNTTLRLASGRFRVSFNNMTVFGEGFQG
ncbi:hypothetical protein DFJ73DRAFT_776311 [Zopfochytrium polystomum]|nr:hypothetical protein DFJ73DRAFT_776311 [Zopfochytrium polystomum]